ncbi:hypothetical protein [Texcoconibacillus texcoconensis]|uniref:hypothetical protein n=1 Tax=Texcoconibacillus texcoconensis TaxID=1095777 RepID=UPI001FE248B2|nr:hypothetical protein [Texcoconibacillus texcoconensis]
MFIPYFLFAFFYMFTINSMTNSLCIQREIPEEKQPKVFRTINVLITILLTSAYFRIFIA